VRDRQPVGQSVCGVAVTRQLSVRKVLLDEFAVGLDTLDTSIDGDARYDAEDMARDAGITSYAVLCGIGNRVVRVYADKSEQTA